MAVKVLLVDDDAKIISSLNRSLRYDGYEVASASDGEEALSAVTAFQPDIIVLDVMMPVMDGLEACHRIRSLTDAPVLMLTARDEVSDRVRGLDAGADDYLVKPFAYQEFIARVKALLRRTNRQTATVRGQLIFGQLVLDTSARQVTYCGKSIELSTREYDLLHLLMLHPREVLTRDFIMDRVWGWDFEGESNVLEVYVRYLRAKLEQGGMPRLIHTVRGVGYVLRD